MLLTDLPGQAASNGQSGTHTHSLSLSHTHTHTHTHTHSRSLSHTLSLSHTHTRQVILFDVLHRGRFQKNEEVALLHHDILPPRKQSALDAL